MAAAPKRTSAAKMEGIGMENTMELKITRCKVCNHPLNMSKDNVYVAKVTNPLFGSTGNYNVTDCPYCGCQNMLQRRYETVSV